MNHKHKPINPRRAMKVLLSTTTLALLASGSPAWADQPKGEFVLIRNEDPVCAPFTRNLNEFRHIDPDVCHPRLSPKYPEFSRPVWREIPLDWWIVETFFNPSLLDPKWKTSEGNRKANEAYWQAWQEQARPLAAQGRLRMWRTEIDVDHDGELDPIVRVERINPNTNLALRPVPLDQRDCIYQYPGLFFVKKPKVPFYGDENHFSLARTTDLIHSSTTQRTYALRWMEDMKHYTGTAYGSSNYFPAPKGSARGVSVGLARTVDIGSPMEICYIAWVPTGASTKLTSDQSWKRQR